MKKNRCYDGFMPLFYQILRKMRLTLLFFLLALLNSIAADSYSQSMKLTLKMENVRIEDLLSRIEDQSKFRFFYNDEVNLDKRVSVDISDETIDNLLNKIFLNTGIQYEITDRQIILKNSDSLANLTVQKQKSVSGKITDSSGFPLPGVSAVVKGTTNGNITDSNGNYSMTNIPANATLVFSFMGMKTQEIAVENRTTIDVVLIEETIGIEEVVAVGYGTQKKVNLTGSVATVSSKNLTVAPVTNVTNAMVGRLPGLISKQESGEPGLDAANISIRGFGAALVIVDGVESKFSDIDANEIESATILKDASAAIYGSRAGNGVILITTKRGNISKPIFTINSSYSLEKYTKMMEPASSGQYTEMAREAWLNAGNDPATAPYTQADIDLYYAGTDPDYPNSNWIDFILRPDAPMQQHNLSIRGGSDKIKYYGFLGYMNQESIIRKGGGAYSRYNFRSNIDAAISDNLNLHINVSGIMGVTRFPFRYMSADVWQDVYGCQSIWSTRLPDKTKIPYNGGTPVAGITNRNISGYRNTDNQNVQGSLALDYDFKPIQGLKARAFFNYSMTYNDYKYFEIPFTAYSYSYKTNEYTERSTIANNSLQQTSNRDRKLTGQFSLNYNRIFAKVHEVSALALYEITDYYGTFLSAQRTGFLSNSIDYLFGGAESNQLNNGNAYEMGRASYIGRLNYAYKSKYLLESTIRYDASAKFSPDSRWGIFPSVSLGWRLSEENFIKNNLPSFDNLKLRASISQAGNDSIGNFQYLTGYNFGKGYAIGSGIQKGITDKGLANMALTWEKMKIYNLGMDFSLLKRKLYGEFDVFYRKRDGILGNRLTSLPTTFGASLPPENINSANDRGFETMIGTEGSSKGLRWDISANISWSRSKWDHFEEPVYTDPDDIRLKMKSGQWVDRTYGYLSEGLFTSQEEITNLGYDQDLQGNKTLRPGDIKYKDLNGDKKIDWRDQAEIGKGTFPHWMFGLNTSFSYRNIDCSVLFQGAFGYTNFVTLRGMNDVLYYTLRWTPENNNPNAFNPRLGGSAMNSLKSDHYLKDVFYTRLKTLSVGYTIPDRFTKKLSVTNLRLYFAGTNLFTLSTVGKYGVDPESPSGVFMYYPQQRTLSFGVNLSL
jgi:TonB-linked SusC/RagA family outer membrane protein